PDSVEGGKESVRGCVSEICIQAPPSPHDVPSIAEQVECGAKTRLHVVAIGTRFLSEIVEQRARKLPSRAGSLHRLKVRVAALINRQSVYVIPADSKIERQPVRHAPVV